MRRWTIVICCLAAAACLVWIAVRQMPDGRLHVIFLDVESGQGVLVRTPSGRSVVIDGGPHASVLLAALGRYLPFWQRTLHAVIATEQRTSAVQALSDVCMRYMPLLAVGPAAGQSPTAAYRQWQNTLSRRSVPFSIAEAGMLIDLGDGVVAQIVGSADEQVALRLTYGGISILLPGSNWSNTMPLDGTVVSLPVTAKDVSRLVFHAGVNSAILFTGRKGQQELNLPAWPEVQVLTTSTHGAVELTTDGHGMSLRQVH